MRFFLNFDEKRIQCILKLKEKYNVYVLSNTNESHIKACAFDVPIIGSFNKLFHKAYYSYKMKMRKPDDIIYTTLLNDAGIMAENTLFLDDSAANIETGKSLGIESWLVTDSDAWVEKISEYLL